MTQQEPLYLDDLVVGAEYPSAEHRLDAGQTVAFAREFDPQPFHLDAQAAKGTFFHGLAASGWHTAAITMRLLVDSVPLGNGIIGAGIELQWPRPTRPDDTLHVVSKIVEITPSRSKPDRGIVTVESLTLNQQGETCQRLVAKLVVMRRPG
ncbi:MAG: MaoC family dehydratase [Proteobacteria bacterium]|nr:MaoC family dehydratase [Pseudomonadota bacterium]